MRDKSDPCKYCDDSRIVCLHQPYENSNWIHYYCEPSSCDESEHESTDFDSDSDEDGSWFTTPWSKLIAKRVAGYEIDPEIGVQLTPIEHPAEEKEEKGDEKVKDESRLKRRDRRRRKKKRRDSAAKIVDSVVETASNEERSEPESTVQLANGGEQVEYIEPAPEPAKNEVQHEKESVPKDVHDNMWSDTVQASVSQLSVS